MRKGDRQTLLTQAMIVVCGDGMLLNTVIDIQRGLKSFQAVRLAYDLAEVDNTAHSPDVLIVSARTATAAPTRLADLLDRLCPAVTVVHEQVSNVQHSIIPGVFAVDAHALTNLLATIFRAAAYSGRCRLAHELESSSIGDCATQILVAAGTRVKPPLSISEAAAFCGCDRSNAAHEWKYTGSTAFAGRLKDALDWVLLARVLLAKTPSVDWSTASALIGLPRERLDRIGKRLTGRTACHILDSDDWRIVCPYRSIRDFGVGQPGGPETEVSPDRITFCERSAAI
jgi:hypothetical protein